MMRHSVSEDRGRANFRLLLRMIQHIWLDEWKVAFLEFLNPSKRVIQWRLIETLNPTERRRGVWVSVRQTR